MADILPFNKLRALSDKNAVVIEAITGEPPKPESPTFADFCAMAGDALVQLSDELRVIGEGFQMMAKHAPTGGPNEAA